MVEQGPGSNAKRSCKLSTWAFCSTISVIVALALLQAVAFVSLCWDRDLVPGYNMARNIQRRLDRVRGSAVDSYGSRERIAGVCCNQG